VNIAHFTVTAMVARVKDAIGECCAFHSGRLVVDGRVCETGEYRAFHSGSRWPRGCEGSVNIAHFTVVVDGCACEGSMNIAHFTVVVDGRACEVGGNRAFHSGSDGRMCEIGEYRAFQSMLMCVKSVNIAHFTVVVDGHACEIGEYRAFHSGSRWSCV
jgi:hypothetical protein